MIMVGHSAMGEELLVSNTSAGLGNKSRSSLARENHVAIGKRSKIQIMKQPRVLFSMGSRVTQSIELQAPSQVYA